MRKFNHILLAVGLLAFAGTAMAVPIVYTGTDNGAGAANPRPNSDAAATAFDGAASALGAVNVIDFESLATGYSAVTALDSNVTSTFAGQIDPAFSGVTASDSTVLGYNTTAGGDNHLRFSPLFNWTDASLTLTFTESISAFGGYFTGLESGVNGSIDVVFDDGSLLSYLLPESANGGVSFWGFTDAGKSIASIAFNEINAGGGSRDIWGMDDISYVIADVPEPSSLALIGFGLLGLGFVRRRRNRA